jgi:ribosomal protein S3AE
MVEIITRDVTSSDLKEVVNKLLPDSIAKDIEKACQGIYPLHDVYIRKVRIHYHITDIILSVVSTVKPHITLLLRSSY